MIAAWGMRCDFQYLKGAIRSSERRRLDKAGLLFQYLKGAIRSMSVTCDVSQPDSFQYLKGAIRSRQRGSLRRRCRPPFNTSKVRLGD